MSNAGITDADRERMGELVVEANERREKLDSKRQVSAAVCADWRRRWRAGEGVLGDIAPGATVSAPTVSKHIHGDCKHPRGGER